MTGGDKISARFMRQDFFVYKPAFKLTILGNHKPGLKNVDDALRRRFNMIPFVHRPPNPDHKLESKLEAEWPAILRWMIDGCLDWQATGLNAPEVVKNETKKYFSEQDVFAQWLADKCVVEPGNKSLTDTTANLYSSWRAFAKGIGEPEGNTRDLSQRLARVGVADDKNVRIGPKQRARGFSGIKLNDDFAGFSMMAT